MRDEHRDISRRIARWRSARDEANFTALVADLSGPLLRTAYLLCYDVAEAEDLVQETWTRLAKRWQRVGGMDNPGAYARRVLINAAIDSQPNRQQRRAELSRFGSDELPERADHSSARALHAVDDQDILARCLTGLTRRQRAVLVLRYFDDLPEQRVADLLNCSVGTVKSTASKALAALRASVIASDHSETNDETPPSTGTSTRACGQ